MIKNLSQHILKCFSLKKGTQYKASNHSIDEKNPFHEYEDNEEAENEYLIKWRSGYDDYKDKNALLYLCEVADVPLTKREDLVKYLTEDELQEANAILQEGEFLTKYCIDYKYFGTLAIRDTFIVELLLKIDNSKKKFYDFLVRTYDKKTTKLIDSQILASHTSLHSGRFNKDNLAFRCFDYNGYWEYKIDEKGVIVQH